MSLRKCTECKLEAESFDELWKFVLDKESKYGYKNLCRPCSGRRTDNTSKKMRDWKTDHQVKKRYGVTREVYLKRMASSTICEVCGKDNDLCYDHDHSNNNFRGILCRGCNRSIGQLGDTLESLQKAVCYLNKEAIQ